MSKFFLINCVCGKVRCYGDWKKLSQEEVNHIKRQKGCIELTLECPDCEKEREYEALAMPRLRKIPA